MALVLFGFWMLLNARWTVEVAAVGAVLSALEYLLLYKFFGYSPRKEWQFLRRLPGFLAYAAFLLGEIFRSGIRTARLIWSPRKQVEPELAELDPGLRTDTGRMLLANSITMTPGTITVDVQEGRFMVHYLDNSFADGLRDSDMERRIRLLEEGKRHG